MHGDPARVPAHNLHQANPVGGGLRLHVRGGDGALGLLHRCVKPKRPVDDAHVVVNGLGNACHHELHAPAARLEVYGVGAALSAVSTNHVQLIDATGLDGVHNHLGLRTTSGGAQDGAPEIVNRLNRARGQLSQIFRVKPTVSVLHPKDVAHTVEVPESVHHFSDDGVEPRAQPPARHDGSPHLLGAKVDGLTGARAREQV
mmetsp:Transcript_5729/g.10829  ORF Transcript_5729/g.10829 Transcript_5729/m.10829 type:complete len:201 (-) Transcript_5729:544-1146(-)